MKKTQEEVKKGIKAHENHDCKKCPYAYIFEDVRKCRDDLIADMTELIENHEERIAIMSEGGEENGQD